MARTSLELRTLAGQLLTFGFDGTEISARAALRSSGALKPGGIILFARNIDSPRQTHALLKAAQKEAGDCRSSAAWTWRAARWTG